MLMLRLCNLNTYELVSYLLVSAYQRHTMLCEYWHLSASIGTLLLSILLSLHYPSNPAAAVPAGVFLFTILLLFFQSVRKSSIGASTLAKTSDREGDRVGRP